jgi:putative FmdB family regulatory protein
MPIYEYECTKCSHRFEKIQKFSDRQVRTCPECKGRVQRLVHAPAIQFKGSGFYINDYSDKGKKPKSDRGSGESGGKSSDTKKKTAGKD